MCRYCGRDGYHLECVYDAAQQRCRDKNESWRWGEALRGPDGKDIPMTIKRRGAGQSPRRYSAMEWAKGYAAWLLLLPLYLFLWAYASWIGRIPHWLLVRLHANHLRTTESKPTPDVRIPFDPNVRAYMLRWWKIPRNAFLNCYYHIVQRGDDDRAHHDHPWWSFSIVVEFGYYEHRIEAGGVLTRKYYAPGSVLFRRSGKQAHRLELDSYPLNKGGIAEIPARTIFITGPVLRRWGFHDGPRGWVDAYDWDDHCEFHGLHNELSMAGYNTGKK